MKTHEELTKARTVRESVRSAARQFAVAGALGFAILIGSPSPAQAQDSRPAATSQQARQAGRHTPAQLSATLSAMAGSRQAPFQPLLNPDAAVVTDNWLAVNELRELLLHAPAQGDALRGVYDAAVSAYGSRDAALSAVTTAAVSGLSAIKTNARSFSDLGNGRETLVAALGRIDRGIGEGDGDYAAFDHGNDVSCVLRMARGGDVCTAFAGPRPQDPAITREDVPLIELQPMTPSSVFLLNGLNRSQIYVLDGATTTTLNSLFGGQSNAQGAVNALGNAYATLANYPSDPTRQAQAAQALHDALSRIPQGRELWSRPEFNAAMAALARGDLRSGLDHLSRETALNAIYQNLTNMHQLNMTPLAVARWRAGIGVRFPEQNNIGEFLDYRRGPEGQGYAWDVLHYDLAFNYTNLLLNFSDQILTVNPATNTLTPLTSPVRVEGEGHAFDLMGGVTWGGSMFKQPVEATLSGRLGYLHWNVDHGFMINGQSQRLDVSGDQPYGELRFNADFVGYEGRTSSFRLSRVGIGTFDLYPFVYFTMTGRWYQSNTVRIETSLTPQYQFFWGQMADGLSDKPFYQNRFSGDLRLLDFSIQAGRNNTIFFGPGFWYNYSARTDQDFLRGINTMEPYVHAAWRWSRGVALDARVGYIFDLGGDDSYHIPNTLTGTFNVVLTPALWGGGSTSRMSGITRSEDSGRAAGSGDGALAVRGSLSGGGK